MRVLHGFSLIRRLGCKIYMILVRLIMSVTPPCFFVWGVHFTPQAARAAISGAGDSGAGTPLTSPPPPPPPASHRAAPVKEKKQEVWVGEEAALAEGFGAEIEGALGAILEQVGSVCVSARAE